MRITKEQIELDIKTGKKTVGRGLVEYTSGQIRRIRGHRTTEIRAILGSHDYDIRHLPCS